LLVTTVNPYHLGKEAMQEFDVVVIGAGPGGQIAAIRAAQLGFRTACVDEWKNAKGGPAPGGTCTNVGCIPSKALLQSSEHFEQAKVHSAEHGIECTGVTVNIAKMISRKDLVVKQNNDGIMYLFRKNKITFIHGSAAFSQATSSGYELKITGSTEETIVGKHIIVATGSSPRPLAQAPFDEGTVLSNDGALRIGAVPKRIGVIGSGVIGLEMGSVWRRLGAEVTILEALPVFLGAADEQIAKEAKKAFDKQNLRIELGVTIGAVVANSAGVQISYNDADGEAKILDVDKLIVSIGRIPNTKGLECGAVGLTQDERGAIVVDEDCRTNLPNVWAIGDVVRGPMLAHKAEDEGSAVAERIAGQLPEVDFNRIPFVIYTFPEIAWVGKTEQQLKAEGRRYKVGTFPFMANGRARAMGQTVGMSKILADAATDEVLGVHIIGPMASELISEGVMALEFGAASEDIARICHAHPTLSETIKEAALSVASRSLNF
jgi:dihydrolipoamide dehydrogenase